jgi:sensor c-di-GMP phosphodiesterase-like protein
VTLGNPVDFMSFRTSRFVHFLMCAIFAGLFAGVAQILSGMAIDSRNRQQAGELATQMLRRAELGVDFAFMALGAIAETNALNGTATTSCTPALRANLRQNVFKRATIKDIRVLESNGQLLCSAFPETVRSIQFRIDLTRAVKSRNGQIRLVALPGQAANELGVIWDLDKNRHLMAIVNTSALLFDILPAAIRDDSSARVLLSGHAGVIASFVPVGGIKTATPNETFAVSSSRFPLSARLMIKTAALAKWNHETSIALLLLAGLLGLAFGVLAVKVLFREPHPVSAIDKALAAREFHPYFQPIYRLDTNQIVGCEVLARWIKADGEIIPPYAFIPLAEQTGRIVPMTWQLVDRTLVNMRPFLRANRDFRIAFNFGVGHLMQDGFAGELRQHVIGARVGTRHVTVEITEREELPDFDKAAKLVAELRSSGYAVALDDAGTGHSGLSYVQKLGADIIKIDKLFVDSVISEHSARVLIGLLVSLAKELGMTTVAEGIETQEQADLLLSLGVDKGQGYLMSPPVPLDVFLPMVELNRTSVSKNSSRRAA